MVQATKICIFWIKNTIVEEFASAKRKLFKRESTMEIKWKKVQKFKYGIYLGYSWLFATRKIFFYPAVNSLYSGKLVYEIVYEIVLKVLSKWKGKKGRNYVEN